MLECQACSGMETARTDDGEGGDEEGHSSEVCELCHHLRLRRGDPYALGRADDSGRDLLQVPSVLYRAAEAGGQRGARGAISTEVPPQGLPGFMRPGSPKAGGTPVPEA